MNQLEAIQEAKKDITFLNREPQWLEDREVVLELIKSFSIGLRSIPKFQDDDEIVLEAVTNYGFGFRVYFDSFKK